MKITSDEIIIDPTGMQSTCLWSELHFRRISSTWDQLYTTQDHNWDPYTLPIDKDIHSCIVCAEDVHPCHPVIILCRWETRRVMRESRALSWSSDLISSHCFVSISEPFTTLGPWLTSSVVMYLQRAAIWWARHSCQLRGLDRAGFPNWNAERWTKCGGLRWW